MTKARNKKKTVSVTKIWDVAKQEFESALGQRVSVANARLLFLTAMEVMFQMADSLKADEQIYFGDFLKAETVIRKGRKMPSLFRAMAHPTNELAQKGVIPTKQVVVFKLAKERGRLLKKQLQDDELNLLTQNDV